MCVSINMEYVSIYQPQDQPLAVLFATFPLTQSAAAPVDYDNLELTCKWLKPYRRAKSFRFWSPSKAHELPQEKQKDLKAHVLYSYNIYTYIYIHNYI